MAVLLIALVFAAFVILDILNQRRRDARIRGEGEDLHRALDETEPHWVAGFRLPLLLHYHRGHTWVHWVSPTQAYVGVDDFARRLIGKTSCLTAPAVGTQISQGEDVIGVRRDSDEARVLSPVTGEVVAVNSRLAKDPALPYRDNYGHGWLYKVKSPLLFKEVPNLMDGTLAKRWMEDTRDRFQHQLMMATGSVIQDGGTSIEDIASGLDRNAWRELMNEFLTMNPGRQDEGS